MSVEYPPSASIAGFSGFSGVWFRDPGAVAFSGFDADRVDAKYFLEPIQSNVIKLIQIAVMNGGAIQVYNATGSTIVAGPVHISGYYGDHAVTGQSIFKIVAANYTGAIWASALLLSDLATATGGIAYAGGDYTTSALNTTGAAIGDPVYLKAGGGETLTATAQQLGVVRTLANPGTVAGFIAPTNISGFSGFSGVNGLGSGTLSVSPQTGSGAISGSDSGKRLTNTGAGGNITLTLPAASVGLSYSFTVVAAHSIIIARAGSDNIRDAGGSDYVQLSSSTLASTITVSCISSAKWTVDNYYGSWAFA
jgi:hypothetical protein